MSTSRIGRRNWYPYCRIRWASHKDKSDADSLEKVNRVSRLPAIALVNRHPNIPFFGGTVAKLFTGARNVQREVFDVGHANDVRANRHSDVLRRSLNGTAPLRLLKA